MKLLIVESPGKIAKLTEILGGDWKVAASVGHIRDLPKDSMGVEPPYYSPDYQLTERGREVVERLKKLTAAAEAVYLATDPDREGESIAWHLKEALRLDKPYRATFNDINPSPVREAVSRPRVIDMQLVAAQEARRVVDRLVGYTVSSLLSRSSGQRMNVGRVQTPAVRLVVDRDRAIEKFVVTQHYGATLHFTGGWTAEWDVKKQYPVEPHYCTDASVAQRVAGIEAVRVKSFENKTRELQPYAPFTTSTLQQAASVRLKLNPKATMDIAQSLYEQGAITYHRTDSPNLSADGYSALAQYAVSKGIKIVAPQRRFKSKADAQEAHEAIRPSHIETEDAGNSDQEKALYRLIRQRALASQMPSAVFAVRSAELLAQIAGREVVFHAKGEKLLSPGWKEVYAEDTEDDGESETANPVPQLAEGDALRPERGEVVTKKTRPPKRFTEASLIKELESQGIGRPSTYAAIMGKIAESGYVIAEKQFLKSTELAKTVVDSLVGAVSFVELGYTRDMELRLDGISEGKAKYRETVTELHDKLKLEITSIQVKVPQGTQLCPACQKPLTRIKGSNGFFWRCAGYPECKTTLPDEKGKPGKPRAPVVVSGHPCPECSKGLVHRTAPAKGNTKGYDLWGCSAYPSCKTTLNSKNGAPDYAAYRGANNARTA